MTHPRPDLAAAFPDVPQAAAAGFRGTLPVPVGTAEHEYQVRAVLPGQVRVPVGSLRLRRSGADAGPLVSVVIPCYRQARFLQDAIESALAQTYPRLEVLIIDDGSPDNVAAVAARYPGVRCLRQRNGGLGAARNAGLRACGGEFVIFLDSDDRLLPHAARTGLDQMNQQPDCALAIGSHRLIDADGAPLAGPVPVLADSDHYLDLLRLNNDCIPSAFLFRRSMLERLGGFDEDEGPTADLDICLRIARDFPLRCYRTPVAEYRRHGGNMTCDVGLMLRSMLQVLDKQWPHARQSERSRDAYRVGVRWAKEFFGRRLAEAWYAHMRDGDWKRAWDAALTLLRYYPRGLWPRRSAAVTTAPSNPPVGKVDFGKLRSLTPISRHFGFDRGQPVDRYYIEQFLARHAADVCGRVLEVGDNAYTRRFGGDRVARSDVLHAVEGNPRATLVADLAQADGVPSDSFDCIILTQTLQLIYDVQTAVRTLYRLLKPGGVLLATVPGISPLGDNEWRDRWCWGFTRVSAQRLLEEAFPSEAAEVTVHGNVLAAISFLHGLAREELAGKELEHSDGDYPVTITLRAVKPAPAVHRARGNVPQEGALILLYHRVAEPASDPWTLSVAPGHFAEHLEVLRRRAHPLPLGQLAQALQQGSLPERAVCVTFDDGYADNFLNARPALDRCDIPATVFLVAGCLGAEREFWWDELEHLLLSTGTLPATLSLTIRGSGKHWELGEAAEYDADACRCHRHWRAWEPPPTPRHSLYLTLWQTLQPLTPVDQRQVLDDLAAWAGVKPSVRQSHRTLSPQEAGTLARGGLVDIGAHTVTHPCLAALPSAAQRAEIHEGKAVLEEVLGRPVTTFAYPYGRLCDYTPDTVAIVKAAGFSLACSNFTGTVTTAVDPLQLPRRVVRDWDGEEFERRLEQWFSGTAQ
jgi:glycosyltransferase involved in cell wall biosynthesis/peptidoglycan/xylan/chitin deacetylase (PgdA/CDA1 family)